MRKLRLLEIADQDLNENAIWYDEREQGLGLVFKDAVESAFERISANPNTFRLVGRAVRRYVVQRFPFAIYYTVSNSEILILRILHASREPKNW